MKLIRSTTGALAFCAVIALAWAMAEAAGAGETSPPTNLAGVWKLNKELSENPGQKIMEAMRGQAGPDGRGPGRGGGGAGGGGMGGGGGAGGGGGMGGGRGGGAGMGGGGMRGGGRGGAGGGLAIDEPPLDGAESVDRPQGPPPNRGGNAADPGASQGQGGGPRPGFRGVVPSPEFRIEQEGDNIAFRTENNLRLLHSDGEKRKKEGASGKQDVTARFIKGSLVIETKAEQGGKRKETYTLREDKKLEIDFEIEALGRASGLKFKLVYDAAPLT